MSEYDRQLQEAWDAHLAEHPEEDEELISFEYGFNAGWNRALTV